jgi:FlaG/FlaF family flagellin (archaellin)
MRILKKFVHDKRAITPVLSNLLLTVIAVAVMVLATSATYVIAANLRETIGERVIIEDLWFNNSTASIDVYLRNIGQVPIQVSAVYVNHTSQYFGGYLKLETGHHEWLNISLTPVSSSTYYVDIVTTRGTHIGDFFNSPS